MNLTYVPKTGDFGVTPLSGPAGPLIRLGQWLNGDGFVDFEHAFVYVGGPDQLIVEAEPGGAVMRPLHYSTGRTAWYAAPPGVGEPIAQAAKSKIGVPYSALDYYALAAVRVRAWPLDKFLRNRVTASNNMICSQLVDWAYLTAGVHLFQDGRTPGDVTPADLYELIVEQEDDGARETRGYR